MVLNSQSVIENNLEEESRKYKERVTYAIE